MDEGGQDVHGVLDLDLEPGRRSDFAFKLARAMPRELELELTEPDANSDDTADRGEEDDTPRRQEPVAVVVLHKRRGVRPQHTGQGNR